MRKHVEMDEPEGLDAADTAATLRALLSAVGTCMTVGFVLNATNAASKCTTSRSPWRGTSAIF
jgi:hypothetical protein